MVKEYTRDTLKELTTKAEEVISNTYPTIPTFEYNLKEPKSLRVWIDEQAIELNSALLDEL